MRDVTTFHHKAEDTHTFARRRHAKAGEVGGACDKTVRLGCLTCATKPWAGFSGPIRRARFRGSELVPQAQNVFKMICVSRGTRWR
eukprot:9007978-Heterocapsa_arctica.AAC.1